MIKPRVGEAVAVQVTCNHRRAMVQHYGCSPLQHQLFSLRAIVPSCDYAITEHSDRDGHHGIIQLSRRLINNTNVDKIYVHHFGVPTAPVG